MHSMLARFQKLLKLILISKKLRSGVIKILFTVCGCALLRKLVVLFAKKGLLNLNPLKISSHVAHQGVNVKPERGADGKTFLHQFRFLLKIMLPDVLTRESAIIALQTATLVARAFLSIYVAALEGRIVKTIVQKDVYAFFQHLQRWLLIGIPATFVNSLIRFLEGSLGLSFRSRLTKHAYKHYFSVAGYVEDPYPCEVSSWNAQWQSNTFSKYIQYIAAVLSVYKGNELCLEAVPNTYTHQTYYRVGTLDPRLADIDQRIAEDVSSFSRTVAHLYSCLTKPVLDIVLISVTLVSYAKRRGSGRIIGLPVLLACTVGYITLKSLNLISPKFGEMVAEEAARKGQLRYLHSRLITNAEEIALYRGENAEQQQLLRAFNKLREQIKLIYRKKLFYVAVEQFLMKYVWSTTGMIMIALPILTAQYADNNQSALLDDLPDGGISERTKGFTTAKNLLMSLAAAAEKLMASSKEVDELAGHTARVYEMLSTFEEINAQKQSNPMIIEETTSGNGDSDEKTNDTTNDRIVLNDIAVITLNGDTLVKHLSLEIMPNMHTLITGPNGCGKTSLFRVMAGLWPSRGGYLRVPGRDRILYVPQRPYLSTGNLREQITYPDTDADVKLKGIEDDELLEILELVHLVHIVEREGGWESKNDWMDVLSGGEKQRLGLARVFYQKPVYAMLDECTSAVSVDVEDHIYRAIKAANITLLTVSHRSSLWKFHTHLLRFDGKGGCQMTSMKDMCDSDQR